MTRKSKKGIVGKSIPTASRRYKVGPGIDLIDHNLTTGREIEEAVKSSNLDKGIY